MQEPHDSRRGCPALDREFVSLHRLVQPEQRLLAVHALVPEPPVEDLTELELREARPERRGFPPRPVGGGHVSLRLSQHGNRLQSGGVGANLGGSEEQRRYCRALARGVDPVSTTADGRAVVAVGVRPRSSVGDRASDRLHAPERLRRVEGELQGAEVILVPQDGLAPPLAHADEGVGRPRGSREKR